jgi:hypothetical protein
MTSSARATSVRREITLTSDPDDLLNPVLQKQSPDGYLTEESPLDKEEEEYDLLSMHRNGRVEFHVTRLHSCNASLLNNSGRRINN